MKEGRKIKQQWIQLVSECALQVQEVYDFPSSNSLYTPPLLLRYRQLMALHSLLTSLGPEIADPEEETFLLFTQALPFAQSLGFVDDKATHLDLTIAGRHLTITQSPALLSSNREQGTTGAVLWKITPLFAEWIACRRNPFFQAGVLNANSVVLELGCGISGIVPLVLASHVGRYLATDQGYLFKILRTNLQENRPTMQKKRHRNSPHALKAMDDNIDVVALDWETSSVPSLPSILPHDASGIDVVIACDCIYNESLIQPFIDTCAEICRLRRSSEILDEKPTFCIIAQQLRSDIVFETWLSAFLKSFRVWRVPDDVAGDGMSERSGFVVHIAVLIDEGT